MSTKTTAPVSMEMLELQFKMSNKTKVRIFVSAGSRVDKERVLGAIVPLTGFDVQIFATEGTHLFLEEHSFESVCVHRVSDGAEPNPEQLLKKDSFDLVINILTGDNDYDERGDSRRIRSLAQQNGIPLFTDVDQAIASVKLMVKTLNEKHAVSSDVEPWDIPSHLWKRVKQLGGPVDHHGHWDKAYTITPEFLRLGNRAMRDKWKLMRVIKRGYTFEDLVTRMCRSADNRIAQGITCARTFVDVDSIVGLLCLEAALEVKKMYAGRLHIEIAIQPLEGILEENNWRLFQKACEQADVIGGLPSRDELPEKHLDRILGLGKDMGKRVDIHTDQANDPDENESLMVARKVIEHKVHGQVSIVHGVSLACKSEREMDRVMALQKEGGVSWIVCPRAALSMEQKFEKTAPIHNSIGPVMKWLKAGIPGGIGIDNVHDMFMPYVDGNMRIEVTAVLVEAIREYGIELIAQMVTDQSLFQAPRLQAA